MTSQAGVAWAPGQRVAIITTENSRFRGKDYWVLGDEGVLLRRHPAGWVVMVNDHEFIFALDELTDHTRCGWCEQDCTLLTTIAGSKSIGTWVHVQVPQLPHKVAPYFEDADSCRCVILQWPHRYSPACYKGE